MDNKLLKKAVIDIFPKVFGNVTQTCKQVDISRQTFYNWLENDEDFRKEIESIEPEEIFVDFAENALVKRIDEGDTTAIIFSLKTKGKNRGYVEKQQLEHLGKIDTGSKEVAEALRAIIENDDEDNKGD